MLEYFEIKNFKSILDEKIDFKTNQRLPNHYNNEDSEENYFFKKNGKKYIPINAFWGANASGKTNIIEAFNTFKKIVLYGNLYSNFCPNKLLDNLDNTIFELSVNLSNGNYVYSIEYNDKTIISEELKFKDKVVFNVSKNEKNFKNLEGGKDSIFDEKKIVDFFEKSCLKDNNQIYTFISRILREYPSLNNKMEEFYNFLTKKLLIFLTNTFPSSLGIDLLTDSELNNSDENLQIACDRITSILKNFDISISKIDFKRKKENIQNNIDFDQCVLENFDCISTDRKNKTLRLDNLLSFHKSLSNKLIQFNFKKDESQGTQILFALIGIILKTFDDGSVLIIDELEKSLHPLIIISIIKMFKSKYWNKNNSQLIFSTHNTDILDGNVLKTFEINIVEKTLKNGTKIKNLSNFFDKNGKKVRNVSNFRKQYLDGIYGGIPFPM